MKTTHPSIFAAGMPACGKSHFGEWLAANHGYRHVDFEKEISAISAAHQAELQVFSTAPMQLINALQKSGPIYFNWGFPLGCLEIAQVLATQMLPVWFWTDPNLARHSFITRDGPSSIGAFEKQSSDILGHSFALDAIFGGNKVKTIDAHGVKSDPEEIWAQIAKF